MLPQGFFSFQPFPLCSRCFYSAYVLLIISSLALSIFLCVRLCPSLPLSMIPFNSSDFLCCSMPSFCGSTTSPNKSSSLHVFPTSAIMTVCSCHVMYAFQSESTLYSCLNVKELLAQSRCEI